MENIFEVAVKAIIQKDDTFLILLKSASEDIGANDFDIPGGRINFGESAEDGLKREIIEETGLKVEIIKLIRTWHMPKKNTWLVGIDFFAEYVSGEVVLSDEHEKFEWKNKEEILRGIYPDWIKEDIRLI